MSVEWHKYGTQTTIYFPLIKASSQNFAVSGDYTHASGDVKISKDGGAAATATNSPSAITMGNGAMWSLTLTATEMQAAEVVVTIIDAATKAVEDQMVKLHTFGHASAKIVADLSAANLAADVQTIKTQAVTCAASVTVSPYVGATGAAVNGTTVNTLASHDPGATIGTSTLTQAQVTGGAYALNSASFAFNAALDFTTTQKAATLARVTLVDTLTTYTGNTPQTGDAFARIGATGSGLTSLAPAATALSSATWTATRAGYLDNLSGGAPPSAAAIATQVDTTLSGTHGSGSWATATGFSTLDAAGVRTAVGLASANLDTQLDALPTASETAAQVAAIDIDGKTLQAAFRIICAAAAGLASGAGTPTETYKGLDQSTTRLVVVADASGNRTSVTYS